MCGTNSVTYLVCGANSVTYPNKCEAECRNMSVKCKGSCPCGRGKSFVFTTSEQFDNMLRVFHYLNISSRYISDSSISMRISHIPLWFVCVEETAHNKFRNTCDHCLFVQFGQKATELY